MTSASSGVRFGPFFLDARVAVGGTSEVYIARPAEDLGLPETVVVKKLLPHLAKELDGKAMFEREARLHQAVRHDSVVRVYMTGAVGDEPYLVMEYVNGVDAYRLFRRLKQMNMPLPMEVGVYIVERLLAALDAMQNAVWRDGTRLTIVHRDVSPSNVYLGVDGSVKLGDFGIAVGDALTSMSGGGGGVKRLMGKLGYLAPEQVAGEASDLRADLFSAAVVLYEALYGQPLFAGNTQLSTLLAIRDCKLPELENRNPPLPAGLVGALVRALARDPKERFASAEEMRQALEPFIGDRTTTRALLGSLVDRAKSSTTSTDKIAAVRPSGKFRVATPMLDFTPSMRVPPPRPSAPDTEERKTPLPSPGPKLLSERSVMVVFAEILSMRASGALVGVGGAGQDAGPVRKEIFVSDGRVQHVLSNDESERFGEYLVSRGQITRKHLETALALLPSHRGRLGDTLVALGVIGPVDVFRAIREHGRDRAVGLFRWTYGTLDFKPGRSLDDAEFPLEMALAPLLFLGLGATRTFDAALAEWLPRLDRTLVQKGPLPGEDWPNVAREVHRKTARPVTPRALLASRADATGKLEILSTLAILVAVGALGVT